MKRILFLLPLLLLLAASQDDRDRRRGPGSVAVINNCLVTGSEPTVCSTSGTIGHGNTVTIAGFDFGTKSPAAPQAWDDATGTALTDTWDGFWPNASVDSNFDMHYSTIQRSIPMPHTRTTKYIVGAHGESAGFNAGYNVIFWLARTGVSFPLYYYASYLYRMDDAWGFCGDNNLKLWDYSAGTEPYDLPENWYIEFNSPPTSTSSTPGWHILDDCNGQACQTLSGPTDDWWGENGINPMSGVWTRIEIEVEVVGSGAGGYVKVWENGANLVQDFTTGIDDEYAGTSRTFAIGGFARCDGDSNNWRYFSDVYADYSRARVVLTDNATYASSTKAEPQIPSAWSDTSITIDMNLGTLTDGTTAYLWVFDSTGTPSLSGLAVALP